MFLFNIFELDLKLENFGFWDFWRNLQLHISLEIKQCIKIFQTVWNVSLFAE